MKQRTAIYWFRNDLRLADNPALQRACAHAEQLALVYCVAPTEYTQWGFIREGQHRKCFLADTLYDLAQQCERIGQRLLIMAGAPEQILPTILQRLGADTVYCETIVAPYETAQCAALRAQGIVVNETWQSSLLDPQTLPFTLSDLPLVFTAFRQQIESAGVTPTEPLSAIQALPNFPKAILAMQSVDVHAWAGLAPIDVRSAFPYHLPAWQGGETAALTHLQRYLASGLADCYKQTRNGLIGCDYSTKFSPWLASGALSARQINQQLKAHEAIVGANDSTYWIWFELLWRDYFRFLHWRFGSQLYRTQGLAGDGVPVHQPELFVKWCRGETGQPFIDAGMRELAATGYLSNRMRQIVASFLIHELRCDWRAGAAWFESQLIDYDVYSNQGNWLYLAGYGTDPRPNRRFNLETQAKNYDPQQAYSQLWRNTDVQ